MEILRPKRETRRSRGTRAKPILLLAALLGICAWWPTAAAQDDDGADALIELSLDELLNVEITSVSKMAEKKSAAAAAIFVLTNEDIRRSGVTTIPDALRLVPGVEVAQIDSSKWSVTARGSAGRFSTKLLVLIDGRSVYTPFFSGVYWEAKDVMLEDVERIEAVVKWLETQYPSPAFPSRREDEAAQPGSTAYYTAYGVVQRGFPVLRSDAVGTNDPPEVLELMHRVTLIPSHQMTLFGPRITIYTKDGKSYTKQATGREFMWDFDEEARRIRDVIPGLPIPAAQFEDIIATCRDLDGQDRADRLIQLTLKQG